MPEEIDLGSSLARIKLALAVPQPIEVVDLAGRELAAIASRVTAELESAMDVAESSAA